MLDLCCGSGDLAFLLSEKVGSIGKVCSNLIHLILLLIFTFSFFVGVPEKHSGLNCWK